MKITTATRDLLRAPAGAADSLEDVVVAAGRAPEHRGRVDS